MSLAAAAAASFCQSRAVLVVWLKFLLEMNIQFEAAYRTYFYVNLGWNLFDLGAFIFLYSYDTYHIFPSITMYFYVLNKLSFGKFPPNL